MKVKELLAVIPDHSRIGIVQKLDGGDKIDTYRYIFSGHRCKYEEFRHVCRVDDFEVREIHAGSWDNKVGLVIGINERVKNEFEKSQ